MKKTLLAAIIAMVGWSLVAADQTAADQQKQKLTREQRQERKALIEKYDANKDGKLDKDELAKMSQEDKDKWTALNPKKQAQQQDKTQKKQNTNQQK
jgi:Ca2+-binding EF-hand superfamily protein